jgi:hypothetical protein
MDVERFASLVRSLSAAPSRRSVGRAVLRLTAGSVFAPVIDSLSRVAMGKHRHHKKKHKKHPCAASYGPTCHQCAPQDEYCEIDGNCCSFERREFCTSCSCCPEGQNLCCVDQHGKSCCELDGCECCGSDCCHPGTKCCFFSDGTHSMHSCCDADAVCCSDGCCSAGHKCCDGGGCCRTEDVCCRTPGAGEHYCCASGLECYDQGPHTHTCQSGSG